MKKLTTLAIAVLLSISLFAGTPRKQLTSGMYGSLATAWVTSPFAFYSLCAYYYSLGYDMQPVKDRWDPNTPIPPVKK